MDATYFRPISTSDANIAELSLPNASGLSTHEVTSLEGIILCVRWLEPVIFLKKSLLRQWIRS
jgi:hypothetical protein